MKVVLALLLLAVVAAGTQAVPTNIIRATTTGAISGVESLVNGIINAGAQATQIVAANARPGSDLDKLTKRAEELLGWASFDSGRLFQNAKNINEKVLNTVHL